MIFRQNPSKTSQEFVAVFSGAFSQAVSDSLAAGLQDMVREKLTSANFSDFFVSASTEFTKTAVAHIVGPLLNIFLRMIDPTQNKLDAILRAPLLSGISQARQALSMELITVADRQAQQRLFDSSLNQLETAYHYAIDRSTKGQERLNIRMAQALIARSIDALGLVKTYIGEYLNTLRTEIDSTFARVRSLENELNVHVNLRGKAPPPFELPGKPRGRTTFSFWEEEQRALEAQLAEAKKTLSSLQAYATFWGIKFTRQVGTS